MNAVRSNFVIAAEKSKSSDSSFMKEERTIHYAGWPEGWGWEQKIKWIFYLMLLHTREYSRYLTEGRGSSRKVRVRRRGRGPEASFGVNQSNEFGPFSRGSYYNEQLPRKSDWRLTDIFAKAHALTIKHSAKNVLIAMQCLRSSRRPEPPIPGAPRKRKFSTDWCRIDIYFPPDNIF